MGIVTNQKEIYFPKKYVDNTNMQNFDSLKEKDKSLSEATDLYIKQTKIKFPEGVNFVFSHMSENLKKVSNNNFNNTSFCNQSFFFSFLFFYFFI